MSAADVVLIGCTKTKRAERAAARDLYDPSDLFRRRRAYAEAAGRPWAILSALYGVVEPDRLIDPYDTTIAQRRTADGGGRCWAIGAIQGCFRLAGRTTELVDGFARYVEPLTIEVHAGIEYVRTLELALPAFRTDITLEHPVAGLGIGEQKRHYANLAGARLDAVDLELEQLVDLEQLALFA
jgi:hypothetical protein